MREPRARVAQANTGAGAGFRERGVVLDAEHQLSAVYTSSQRDASGALDLVHAVLDRVLDDRLKDQIRYERVERALLHIRRNLETPLKAHFHNLEIPAQQVELLAKRSLLLVRPFDGVTQQLAEPRDHSPH